MACSLKKAFTLAEILIVIGIIGVVAQMTIPTLVQNYQKTQYVAELKKAYTETQQAFNQYLVDEGVSSLGDTDLFDGVTDFSDTGRRQKLDNVIRKYFKVIKSCVATTDTSCDENMIGLAPPYYKSTLLSSSYYIAYLSDGTKIFINFSSASCNPDFTKIGKMKADCGFIRYDLNGDAPPNKGGRDIMMSYKIGHEGNLYPTRGVENAKFKAGEAWETTNLAYWKVGTGNCDLISGDGIACITRIMEEGWQMNY